MPYINVSTSAKIEDKKKLLEEISILVASLTNKSKRFVMVEIKSIGSLNPSEMAKQISNFVYEKMGIPIDKIYISFEDVPASLWAWNGRTFG